MCSFSRSTPNPNLSLPAPAPPRRPTSSSASYSGCASACRPCAARQAARLAVTVSVLGWSGPSWLVQMLREDMSSGSASDSLPWAWGGERQRGKDQGVGGWESRMNTATSLVTLSARGQQGTRWTGATRLAVQRATRNSAWRCSVQLPHPTPLPPSPAPAHLQASRQRAHGGGRVGVRGALLGLHGGQLGAEQLLGERGGSTTRRNGKVAV